MDKEATLRALMASPWIAMLHLDLTPWIAYVPFRGGTEPVLIYEESGHVGWIRLEGPNAIWRHASLLNGVRSDRENLGHSSKDGGRAVANALERAWDETTPLHPPANIPVGEAERFVAAIEAGEKPVIWSPAKTQEHIRPTPPVAPKGHYVYAPSPARAKTPPAPPQEVEDEGAGTVSSPAVESPYATEFSPYRHDKTRYPAAPGYSEQQLDGRILETVYPAVLPAVIGGVALFLAILSMPYEFYVLLRWLVPSMAIWMCVLASGQKRTGWVVVFSLIAVLWNPLVPIEMPRTAWVLPDLVGAALFAAAGYTMPASKPALRKQSRAQL